MPRKRFTNEQIAFALRQAENGATVDEVCRKMVCPSRRSTAGRSSSSAWRAGDPTAQATGGREQQTQTTGGRPDAGPLHAAGRAQAKVVRPAARREVRRHLQVAYGISERRACQATSFGRSSQRYRKRSDPQVALRMRLKELAAARVRYGYRRLHILLRREGWKVNHKRTYRIYRMKGCRSGPNCPSASEPGGTVRGDRRSVDPMRSGRWTSSPTASSTDVHSGS